MCLVGIRDWTSAQARNQNQNYKSRSLVFRFDARHVTVWLAGGAAAGIFCGKHSWLDRRSGGVGIQGKPKSGYFSVVLADWLPLGLLMSRCSSSLHQGNRAKYAKLQLSNVFTIADIHVLINSQLGSCISSSFLCLSVCFLWSVSYFYEPVCYILLNFCIGLHCSALIHHTIKALLAPRP